MQSSAQTAPFRIAVLPGDGIGPEVMRAAIHVLEKVQSCVPGLKLIFDEHAAGAGEFQRSGDPLPEHVRLACHRADAVLLGAMGLPCVRWPDGRELTPQIDLREIFQLYQGIRPVFLYHQADCPLKHYKPGEIDLVIVRESTEGLFSTRLRAIDPAADAATDQLLVTRERSQQLFHAAFQLARTRRRHLTLVDKANVLPSMVFFRRIFDEVAEHYSDVTTNRLYVDAASLLLVRQPTDFDVIVTENMFGDILSDLAAALVGGMGMAPSADIGDDTAVFQPCHGTAPDLIGRGIANPIAMVLSAAMMLEWLDSDASRAAALRIRRAVTSVMRDPSIRTPDMGGSRTTVQITAAIVDAM